MMRLALLVLLLAACSGAGTIDGNWQLTSGTSGDQSIPLSEANPITIEFSGDQVSGSGGCNQYSGTFEVDGSSISFGAIAITERACLEDDVMQAESLYGRTLTHATTYTINGDQLTLTGPAGVLTFDRT